MLTYNIVGCDLRHRSIFCSHIVHDIVGQYTHTTVQPTMPYALRKTHPILYRRSTHTYDIRGQTISHIWILANRDITVLPFITGPGIGIYRISQHPSYDIGVSDIGTHQYYSTLTVISKSQYSNSYIDSDNGGAVISQF